MSQPFSRFLHPFDVARHPQLEPEVKRAILASWSMMNISPKLPLAKSPAKSPIRDADRRIIAKHRAASHALSLGHSDQLTAGWTPRARKHQRASSRGTGTTEIMQNAPHLDI